MLTSFLSTVTRTTTAAAISRTTNSTTSSRSLLLNNNVLIKRKFLTTTQLSSSSSLMQRTTSNSARNRLLQVSTKATTPQANVVINNTPEALLLSSQKFFRNSINDRFSTNRLLSTIATSTSSSNAKSSSSNNSIRLKILASALVVGTGILQYLYGNEKDFYEYRFVVNKDPDDLFSFYGGEEFMEIFCVMPFVATLMMRGGTFDEHGTIHTTGLPGTLQVSMVFSDYEDEENDEGILWFNKRERFKDVIFGKYKMWDMVTNFGFHKLEDGTIECYHHGEYFVGNIPPISLIIKLVFQVHARWVAWATEHHINHHAFTSETEEEELMEETSKSNMVWHLLKYHVWADMKAMIFGVQEKEEEAVDDKHEEEVSFLVKKKTVVGGGAEEEDEVTQKGGIIIRRMPTRKLMEDVKTRIEEDIKMDREMFKANAAMLGGESTNETSLRPTTADTSSRDEEDDYRKITKSAMQRHQTLRVSKRASTRRLSKIEKRRLTNRKVNEKLTQKNNDEK